MSDFDFDELDRAVNGAIGDEPSTPVVAPSNEAAATFSASASTPAPAVRRSSGRFMDVVHPSSDMRSTNNTPQLMTRKTSQPPVMPREESSVRTETPEPTTSKPVQEAVASNPFDLIDDWQTPLESPFLPDAKVEKRPLGGEAPSTADFDALELLEAPDEPRIEAHTMPDPLDFAPQAETVEPELGTVETPTETPDIEQIESQEIPEVELHADTEGYGQGAFQQEPEETPEVPAGPASISQQYQEQPSTSPEPGAVFDTTAYHQPLAPLTKKRSGAWVVLWIFLIVLLGGGAGAAFYFYVMPML